MLSLTIKSIRANKARFVVTSVAIVLGVAFMAGTLVLTDTIQKSYDTLSANVYRSTDALVRSPHHSEADGVETRGTISASALATVRAARGVRAAEGQQLGVAIVVGHDGKLLDANRNRAVPIALGWQETPELNPMRLVTGHAPRSPDEIVIDRMSQRRGSFSIGEKVQVVTPTGSHEYRIAGVATYGGTDSAAGGQVVAFTQQTAAEVFGARGRFTAIQVLGRPGVSQTSLAANVRAALAGSDSEVITGAQASREPTGATSASFMFVSVFLMIFAIVALVVGSFVIYNTFSITVAQRTKETALLRAIGARRRQVMRAIRLEALLAGVLASAVGVAVGIGFAFALRSVLAWFSLELPSGNAVIAPRTIIISMITGTVVTFVAAWLPARRASKVAPIEALRDTAHDTSAHSKQRLVVGGVVGVLGAVMIVQGLTGAGANMVSLGVLAVFVGVAMLGPVIARRFAQAVGSPLPAMRGTAGALARDNAMRNPRRTSATASALMVGVALVVFITVFASSAKASLSTGLDKAMTADWIVTTQPGMGGLSPEATQRLDALPETGTVTPLRYVQPQVDGRMMTVTAIAPANVDRTIEFDLRSGNLAQLGRHEVAVQADEARKRHLRLGDTVTMSFPETGNQKMKVVAEYGTKEPMGDYTISVQAFDANVAARVDDVVLVSNAPGVSMQAARRAIDHALKPYPTTELMTKNEFKGSMASQIDQMLNLVYVMLAMALAIALFGIANTLALSVLERTREFGLLRAVGASRAQVRSTVRWESVLIALLGTSLGSLIGVGFGWTLIKSLADQGLGQFTLPAGQLAVIVLFAAFAAVVAATIPARRAARLDVLRAISTQ